MTLENVRLEVPFGLSCKESAGCKTEINLTAIITLADGLTLDQLVERAARPMVINWQNKNRPDNESDLLKLADKTIEIMIVPVNARGNGEISTSKAIDKLVERKRAGKLTDSEKQQLAQLLADLTA